MTGLPAIQIDNHLRPFCRRATIADQTAQNLYDYALIQSKVGKYGFSSLRFERVLISPFRAADYNCLPLGVSTVPTIARPPHFTIMTIALLKRCEAQRHAGLGVYSFQCGAAA